MHILAFILMLFAHIALIALFARAMAPTIWKADASPYNEHD